MKNLICYVIIIFFLPPASAQSFKTGRAEKRWALFHPLAAMKVKRIYKKAAQHHQQHLAEYALDPHEAGGRPDAFRHIYYMAAFAQQVRIKAIRRLGKAHEKENKRMFTSMKKEFGALPDSIDSVMDLYNNELGFVLGKKHAKAAHQELALLSLALIRDGKALIVKRNKTGNLLDCEGRVISEPLPREWKNNKCLTYSDGSAFQP